MSNHIEPETDARYLFNLTPDLVGVEVARNPERSHDQILGAALARFRRLRNCPKPLAVGIPSECYAVLP